MKTIGSMRKVVLSALYANVLTRTNAPHTRIEELVRATEASSVSRVDLVARISELHKVGFVVPSRLHRADP